MSSPVLLNLLKGAVTLKASVSQMQALIKGCKPDEN